MILQKRKFFLLALITLLLFPSVGMLLLYFIEGKDFVEVLELNSLLRFSTMLGIGWGFLYGVGIMIISKIPRINELYDKQKNILKSLHLTWFHMAFVSFCAGFGEEVLFRAALQTWLGPWWTTLIFIAIHGYLDPRSWRKMLPGILLFPFILTIAFGYEKYGLWCCVGAHTAYDFAMFASMKLTKD